MFSIFVTETQNKSNENTKSIGESMSGDFLGTFENSINKDRIVIPAPFKAKFSTASKQTVVCSLGPKHDCVVIYPLDNWNKKLDELMKGDDSDKDFLDHLTEYACQEQKLEGPGRIRISSELQRIANIGDSVVIQGMRSYIVLWDIEVFKANREMKLKATKDKWTSRNYQI
jgi:MraZ protein